MGEMTNNLQGFKRVSANHHASRYRHAETGIEIVRVPAHRKHGYGVGVRWHISIPQPGSAPSIYGAARTLKDAVAWATEDPYNLVGKMRARIAGAWDEAHAENERRDLHRQFIARMSQLRPWLKRNGLAGFGDIGTQDAIERDFDEAHLEDEGWQIRRANQ